MIQMNKTITKESLESAEDYLMNRKEQLLYCQKVKENLLDSPLKEVCIDEFKNCLDDEKLLKAQIEAIQEYKERLGLTY